MSDPVKHPAHYGRGRFGIECIAFARWLTFPAGNAFKYVWRHEDKGKPIEDLSKALQYLEWANDDDFLDLWPVGPVVSKQARFHLELLTRDFLLPNLPYHDMVYTALEDIINGEYSRAKHRIEERIFSIRSVEAGRSE